MLKYIKVPIIIDDHEPEKCGQCCIFFCVTTYSCKLFNHHFTQRNRCEQCLEDAK